MELATFWTCSQSPPVSDRESVDCEVDGAVHKRLRRRRIRSRAGRPATRGLRMFQRWAGCDSVTGATCYLDVPSGG